jgi:predicted Zn finger-like uncharacterized protein
MPMVIDCPSCNRKLNVPESLLGQLVKCPTCGATFTAVDKGPAIPSTPPPPEDPTYQPVDPDPAAPQPSRRGPLHDEDDDFPRRRRRNYQPHRGAVVLTLGILSLVICCLGVILGPIAWVMGNNDMTDIRAGRMDPEGEGLTNAGRICGIIGTILGGLNCLGCVGWTILRLSLAAAVQR